MSVDVLAWVADALVVLALVVMTVGVIGLRRMPDVYTQLHATSKAVVLGVIAILVASAASREPAIISRAALIGAFLLVTTPVSAHVIARAAYLLREPMRTPGAIDESDGGLTDRREAREGEPEDEDHVPRPRALALESIVVGYDGSDPANRALERAAALAGSSATLTLVTAGAILPDSPPEAAAAPTDEAAEHLRVLEEGQARLAELGVEARIVEKLSDPATALIDTAREVGADLIVVGTRGRNVAARMVLGSVSASVVSRAPCDVLVVR